MAFLVVTLDDQIISEVPVNWLEETDDDTSQFWWPANCKIISSLIAKRAEPDKKTWKLLPIKIEKFCQSLEKARKFANDEFYKTTDDEDLEKGRRTRTRRVLTSSEDEENIENVRKTGRRQQSQQPQKRILSDLPVLPNKATVAPKPTSLLEIQPVIENTTPSVSPDHIEASTRKRNDDLTFVPCANVSEPTYQEKTVIEACDTVPDNRPVQENQKIIIRMLASLQVQVREVSQKLNRRQLPGSSESTDIIKSHLPLKSIAEIQEFAEKIRKNPDFATKFTQLVRKVGGCTAREDTTRIFRKVFTNPYAQLCSWKGRKENFCIEELQLAKTIQEAILEQYPFTKEIDFEETVSDWFRFAKQWTNRETETR